MSSRSIAKITSHPLRAVLEKTQRTSQGDYPAIELVVVEVTTSDGVVGFGEGLARRGSAGYARLIDDVLDYRSDPSTRGKNLGEDLAEGKPTLPLIHALRNAGSADRELIRAAITGAGAEDQPEPDLARIIGCIDASGGIEYTRERALSESRAAAQALAPVNPSPWRDALAALADVAVQRDR
jgi:hypothetical protein